MEQLPSSEKDKINMQIYRENSNSKDSEKETKIHRGRRPLLRILLSAMRRRIEQSKEKRELKRNLRKEKSKLRKIRRTEKLRQEIGKKIIEQSKDNKL